MHHDRTLRADQPLYLAIGWPAPKCSRGDAPRAHSVDVVVMDGVADNRVAVLLQQVALVVEDFVAFAAARN